MDPQDSIEAMLAQYFDEGEPQQPPGIYKGGEREGFVPREKGTFLPREFFPDQLYRPPPPDTAGESAENYNPMLVPKSKRIPDLPPDYQIERRPYVGPEVTMEEFDKRLNAPQQPGGFTSPPSQYNFGSAQKQIERLLDYERRYDELKQIDPKMAERFKEFGLGGPGTDSEVEYVYGPRAVGREMRGGDPLAGGFGMDREDVGRQPVYPLRRRFQESRTQGRLNAEMEAELQQEQDEREMMELEQHGIDPDEFLARQLGNQYP